MGASGPVLFGKLPARADFVRRGAASPALDAFDALTQRALRSGARAADGPLYRMVYVPPGGPHALVGALRLSRDRVGRAYPLVAGRTVEWGRLDPVASASWPLRWRPLLDGAAALVDAAVRGGALPDLDARLDALPELALTQGRSREVDTHVRALSALHAHDLWARLWGASGPSCAGFVFGRLAAAPSGLPAYGLRFPLPPSAPDLRSSDVVAVWLAVCWYLLPTPTAPPTLFWTDGPPGALVVFFAGVGPSAFRALLAGTPDPGRIAHVDGGPDAAVDRTASGLPPSFRRLLRDPRASVADVLARLHMIR